MCAISCHFKVALDSWTCQWESVRHYWHTCFKCTYEYIYICVYIYIYSNDYPKSPMTWSTMTWCESVTVQPLDLREVSPSHLFRWQARTWIVLAAGPPNMFWSVVLIGAWFQAPFSRHGSSFGTIGPNSAWTVLNIKWNQQAMIGRICPPPLKALSVDIGPRFPQPFCSTHWDCGWTWAEHCVTAKGASQAHDN